MNEIQLIIKTPDSAFLKAVEFNYQEVATWLEKALKEFDGVIYDDITQAKTDRAKLNKLSEAMDSERKRVKNLCLQAYEPFETKIKELTGKVVAVNFGIDKQVKAYENLQQQKKHKEIKTFFNENVGELSEVLTLENIFNQKWLNVGYKIEKIKEEIIAKFEQINRDFKTLDKMDSPFSVQLKDMYLKCFDIGAVLIEKHRLEEQKLRLDALKAKQAPKEEIKRPITDVKVEVKEEVQEQQKLYSLSFKVIDMTSEQLQTLKSCMTENNIKYERI